MTNPVITTIIIHTANMAELAECHRRGFELRPPQATGDDHLGFALPGVYLGFDQVEPDHQTQPGAVSAWFEVDDLRSTYDRFLSLGASARYPPTQKPWGAKLASIHDLDGNMIGLAQRGSGPN
jgi:catechol 2,3-dioxygenase-like lactoylglutathione lyase family enzyme